MILFLGNGELDHDQSGFETEKGGAQPPGGICRWDKSRFRPLTGSPENFGSLKFQAVLSCDI